MSAFVVTNEHINVIVTAANYPASIALHLGRMLLSENIASVAHRYRLGADSEELQGYEAQVAEYAFEPVAASPAQVLKAIACLEYQSCEHPGWDGSEAQRFLEVFETQYIHHKGTFAYEAAAWGI